VSDHDEAPPPKPKPKPREGGSGRLRRVALAVVAVLVLAGAIVAGRFGVPRWIGAYQAKQSGAALHRCLFGEPPRKDERPERRLRQIYLTAVGLEAPEKPAPTGHAWPGRCAEHADALADALRRAGKPDLAPPLDLPKRALETAQRMFDKPSFPLVALWEMYDEGGGPIDIPLPPAPARALDLDAPNLAERIAFGDFSADAIPGRGLRIAFRGDRGGGPIVAELARDLASARSVPIQTPVKLPRPMLWPAADPEGPALVTDRSSARSTFFRADTGQPFGEAYKAVGGFSAPNDKVGLVEVELGPRGEELALWLERAAGERRVDRVRVEPPPRVRFAGVHVLGPMLAWTELRSGKPHLFFRNLGLEKGPAGPIEDAGELPTDAVRFSACQSNDVFTLALREGGSVWFTQRQPNGKPSLARVDEGATPKGTEIIDESIACEDGAASMTTVLRRLEEGRETYEVRRARCTREGCVASRVALADLFRGRDEAELATPPEAKETAALAVSIGEELVIVWRTSAAGLRARIATPDRITSATDIVVYDEASQDVNNAGRIHAMRLFGREGAALLLLHAVSGIKAIRIGKDSTTRAIRIEP